MPNVLVFESDPQFASELKEGLLQQGCTATVVGDATEGLQVAASSTPDLILLTVELPRVNGFSVCNKLKRDPSLSGVPLIILSSDSTEDTFNQHRRLKNSRAQDYIHKPVGFPELLPRIANLVALPSAELGGSGASPSMSDDVVHIAEESYVDLDEELEEIEDLEELDARDPEEEGASVDAEVDEFTEAAFDNLLDEDDLIIAEEEVVPEDLAVETEVSEAVEPLASERNPNAASGSVQLVDDGAFEDITSVASVPIPAELTEVDSEIPSSLAAPTLPPPSEPPAGGQRLSESEALAALDPQVLVEREAQYGALEAKFAERERLCDAQRDEIQKLTVEVARVESAAEVSASQVLALDEQKTQSQEQLAIVQLELRQATARQTDLETQLQGAQSERAGAGSAQEFLALREQLNAKDKEILELHTQVGQKTRELLGAREGGLKFERELGVQEQTLRELQGEHQELARQQEATQADKEQAAKRADDFKRRGEKATAELEAQNQVVEDQRLELVEAAQRHQAEADQARAEAERQLGTALDALRLEEEQARSLAQEEWRGTAERAQSTALEHQESRLKTEYEQAFAQLAAEQAVAYKNLQEESEAKLLGEQEQTAQANEQTARANEQSAALAEKLEQLQTQHAETEANRAATSVELEREKEQHREQVRAFDETKAELAVATTSLVETQAQVATTSEQLAGAQQSVQSLGEQVSRLEQELTAYKAQIERMEQEVSTSQAQSERLDQELAAARANGERLEGELSEAQATGTRLEQELSAATEKVAAGEAEASRLNEALAASTAMVAQGQENHQRDLEVVGKGRDALATAVQLLAGLESHQSAS